MVSLAGVGGYYALHRPPGGGGSARAPFASRTANGLTVNFYLPRGQLRLADNDMLIEFRDAATHEPADVGEVKFEIDMNMPGMAMHSGGSVTADGPGRYRVKFKPEMAGDWTAQLRYNGARGSGTLNLTVNIAQ